MSEVLLDVSDLVVRYGPATALDHLSLRVETGESIFVVGPNGAGKTTLLRAISGLERSETGSIDFASTNINKMAAWDIVRLGIAHVPQNRRCFGPLSVEENLVMGGYSGAKEKIQPGLASVYKLFPVLLEKRKQNADKLSGGQQQMVAIGRALMADAKLIMLDEPSLGLAPMLVDSVGDSLTRIHDEFGTSILIVEQNVNLALSVASRGYVLRSGKVIAEGHADDLRGQLRDAYLGSDKDLKR